MAKVAGKQLSWLALIGLSVATAAQVQACNRGGSGNDTATNLEDSTLVADVLSNIGPSVILPALSDFAESLDHLKTALSDWSTNIEDSGDVLAAQSAAQESWGQAMHMWQRLEVMQVGPAGSALNTIAGEDIRDEIYSWPTVNYCRVDQKTATGQWQEEDFIEVNLVNAYGLDALEHLLFAGDEPACNPAVPPGSDGTWDAMGQEGVWAARAGFATVLTDHLIGQTTNLTEMWSATGSNFSGKLAGTADESVYSSNKEALNAIYDAMFYLETDTKDRKLAQPLGLRDCETEACPGDLEGLVSGQSLDMLAANLEGFEALFTGGEELGFKDLLSDLGHGDLAESMLVHAEGAKNAILAFEGSLYDAIENGDGQAMELFDTLGLLTSEIKWDVATVLSMNVPTEAVGDND
jgi:predicted lipoprotein